MEYSLIFTGATAIFAAFAAAAAWKSARESKRSIDAGILMKYRDEYSSEEFLKGIELTKRNFEDDKRFVERFPEYRDLKNKSYDSIDNIRRKIGHRFTKLMQLKETNSLDEKFILKMATKDEIDFYLNYVDLLDRKIVEKKGKEYDESTYNFVMKLNNKSRKFRFVKHILSYVFLKPINSIKFQIQIWIERDRDRKLAKELMKIVSVYYSLDHSKKDTVEREIRKKINTSLYAEKMVEKIPRLRDFEKIIEHLSSMENKPQSIEKLTEKTWHLVRLDELNYQELDELNNLLRVWGLGNLGSQDLHPQSALVSINKEIQSKELELFLLYMFFVND